MIVNFLCKHTQALFEGEDPARFRGFPTVALRKRAMLDASVRLEVFGCLLPII
jgi:proteic killer suppression protein